PLAQTNGPVKVEIRGGHGGYQLWVDQRPFYIKGAGLGNSDPATLAAAGANSMRTWQSSRLLLDRAQANGLYVTLGLDVARERQGFNYNDPAAVARQKERIRQEVLKYKDHPALIIWAIGNELNLNATNARVWEAVNELSKMIHALDPNHLTTTPLAGFNEETVETVQRLAPDLDLISLQMYADVVRLPHYLAESRWTGPYLLTEWGATGHWEVGKTAWGAPLEDNSSVKAAAYKKRYETAIAVDTKRCLGSYVFLWGHKQERTPTWYGVFLDSGETTEAVEVMQYLWTGEWPASRCPELAGAWLDGRRANQNIHLRVGGKFPAKVSVTGAKATDLAYSWEVLEESRETKVGGDHEDRPRHLPGLVQTGPDGTATVAAPDQPGAYRLFAYIRDGHGHAAHANIPFYVDAVTQPAGDQKAAPAQRHD
ncbi:MAG TPA: glycoside hydrolase family 2 TIM barrel-domain containing protein, partial [Verrucomicrobiae bacterium]